ncbi:MAG TPA: HAMP domain-containing sensor histidine kinase [Woeseiaceae bacterium]|jgi:signal transduction histidine kinase|nr:HAMP domain-containing sensor histidine kinase [Woeseiaceae bacterium]
MLRGLSRSISFRLLGIFLVLAGLFVWGTISALRWVYNSDEIRGLISGHLSLHVSYVRDDIGSPPRIDRALAITQRVPVDIRILGPDLDWASNPAFPRLDELEFGPSPLFSNDPSAWIDELRGVEFAVHERHRFLKMRQGDYEIVVVSPRISETPAGPDLTRLIIGMGLIYLLLGYASVSWLFKPIRAIRAGAAHIGRGDFNRRIENIRSDQLGDLAEDINRLAGDVESMLDAKRALLLGVSHELRTPLSRMNLVLELMNNDDDREALKPEVAEMEKIITSLLEAERLSTRHEPLTRAPVQIGSLASRLIDDYFARDRERVKIVDQTGDIEVDVDGPRIMLLLKNLVGNALRYSPADSGPVTVELAQEGAILVLRITDCGPGLSEVQARHIGEPFYRSDPSRTRDTGGTGLGLYLAKLVAVAHGGSLELVNPGKRGARFECRIPI